jgi:ABC transporter substrate binding protein
VGGDPNFGVIVVPDPATNAHRKLINELATRHRLPVIHALRAAVAEGGLLSYGVNLPNLFRQAAVYADRILKGEKPGRPAGSGADQVRACDQSYNRKETRYRRPAVTDGARRRDARLMHEMFGLLAIADKVIE